MKKHLSVWDLLWEAHETCGPDSTIDDIFDLLVSLEPSKNLNYKHATFRINRWREFLHGNYPEGPYHPVRVGPYMALQLAVREMYLESVNSMPFKWGRGDRWSLPR